MLVEPPLPVRILLPLPFSSQEAAFAFPKAGKRTQARKREQPKNEHQTSLFPSLYPTGHSTLQRTGLETLVSHLILGTCAIQQRAFSKLFYTCRLPKIPHPEG